MTTRRCVVTGQDAEGKSVFVFDGEVDPLVNRPGSELHRMWGSDVPPTLPTDGSQPDAPLLFPPPGGYRFNFVTIAPDAGGGDAAPAVDPEAVAATAKQLGTENLYEKGKPGMHTTDTIDLDFIVSGELWLELDDGAEVHLKPGDCIVQNGTRHAWHNRTSEPTVMLAVCIGAPRTA